MQPRSDAGVSGFEINARVRGAASDARHFDPPATGGQRGPSH